MDNSVSDFHEIYKLVNKDVLPKDHNTDPIASSKISNNSFLGDKHSAFSLFNYKLEEIPKLVDPIFPKSGLVSLVGSSDTGKSTLLRQLSLCIALGTGDFIGYPTLEKPQNVIYISSEDDAISTSMCIKRQYTGLSKMHPISQDLLNHIKFVFDDEDLSGDSLSSRIESILKTTRVSLIIIDAFTDVFGNDLNSSTAVRNFFKDFSRLAKKYECLILFLHHTGKGKDKLQASKDNVLGSQAFEAKMRVLLELRRHPNDENLRTLTITKGNYISSSIKKYSKILKFEEETLLFSFLSDIPTDNLAGMSKRVKNSDLVEKLVLQLKKEGKTIRAIETELKSKGHKVSRGTVSNIISRQQNNINEED